MGVGLGGTITDVHNDNGIIHVSISHVGGGHTTCTFNARGKDKRALGLRKGSHTYVDVKCDLVSEEDIQQRIHELESQLDQAKADLAALKQG